MNAKRWKPIVGKSQFRFEPVKSERLPFVAEVDCLLCGEPLSVSYGAVAKTFRIGNEVVGVCCDECVERLSSEDRPQEVID